MAQDERITRALAIEQRRLAERREVLMREADQQSLKTRSDFAVRGLAVSGMVITALIDLQVEYIRNAARAACDIRREMCRTVPELASAEELRALRNRLHEMIDATWAAVAGTLSAYGYREDVPRILSSAQYDSTTLSIKSAVNRELKNIEDEVALGMHRPRHDGSSITINITGGMVGGINLGAIAGDMNTAINTLHGAQGEALAQAIKRVTEAVAADTSLSPEDRAETVEHLATIAGEAALLPERRKWRTVRTLAARVGSIILKAPQLIDAWNTLHAQLFSWFGQPPPGM